MLVFSGERAASRCECVIDANGQNLVQGFGRDGQQRALMLDTCSTAHMLPLAPPARGGVPAGKTLQRNARRGEQTES
eukprot:1469917-Amphidinium_carterae.1